MVTWPMTSRDPKGAVRQYGRLSKLGFESTLNSSIVSYRIVSYAHSTTRFCWLFSGVCHRFVVCLCLLPSSTPVLYLLYSDRTPRETSFTWPWSCNSPLRAPSRPAHFSRHSVKPARSLDELLADVYRFIPRRRHHPLDSALLSHSLLVCPALSGLLISLSLSLSLLDRSTLTSMPHRLFDNV